MGEGLQPALKVLEGGRIGIAASPLESRAAL